MNMQALEPGTAASYANAETEALAEGEFTQQEDKKEVKDTRNEEK
jgi:hypothetical protein